MKDLYIPPVNGGIKVYLGSYEDVIPKINDPTDAIFFDPPWVEGGDTYNIKNPVSNNFFDILSQNT